MTNTLVNGIWQNPVLFNAPTGQNNRQHPDVASRRAYRLGTVNNISDVSGIYGLYSIFVGVSEGVPGDVYPWASSDKYKGKYEGLGGGGIFTPGTQPGSGPTWVILWSQEFVEIGSNPRFKMTTTRGSIWVYLPSLSLQDGMAIPLFLTEDGSTYWGHTSKSPQFSNYFNQDAYYAERWADNNLARSAFNGSGSASPAIDEGSRDFLSNGYTNTDLSGDPDNPGIDSRIDIGFHYFGSLRHPRENVPPIDLVVDGYGFSQSKPTVEFAHQMAMSSAKFDANQNDTTIVTYRIHEERPPGDPDDPWEWLEFVIYKKFRGSQHGRLDREDEVENVFKREQSAGVFIDPKIAGISMASVPKGDSYSGTIYAACAVNWWNQAGPSEFYSYKLKVKVWRYDEINNKWDDLWTHSENVMVYAPSYVAFANDVALVARNDDLWVFWTRYKYAGPGQPALKSIKAVRLPNAASDTTLPIDPGPGAIVTVRVLNKIKGTDVNEMADLTEDPAQIYASWDKEAVDYFPAGSPRIIWWDLEADGQERIRSAKVPLDEDGKPRPMTEQNTIITTIWESASESFYLPSISVNQYDTTKFTISGAKRAFSSCQRSVQQPKIQGARLTCSDTSESWQHIEITDRNNSSSPNTTFRAFGTPRISFVNVSDIFTNTEFLRTTIVPAQDKMFTRITTNTGNLMDVFLIYSHGPGANDVYTLDIMELDP